MFHFPLLLPPALLWGYLLIHILFCLLVSSQPNQRRAGSCLDFVLPFFLYRKGEKGKTAPWKLAAISCFPSPSSFAPNSFSTFFRKAFKLPLPWKHAAAPPYIALETRSMLTLPRNQGVRRWPEGIQEITGELRPCSMCSTDSKPHWELFPIEPLQNLHKVPS